VNIDLKEKTAVVCGGSAGIGFAVAQQLAMAGAKVVLLARNVNRLNTALNKLSGSGHLCFSVDFSDNDAVKKTADNIAREHAVDILINNTGGPPAGPLVNANTDEFLSAFQAHLINNHLLSKTFLPGMIERQFGRIINIISTSVKIPLHNLGVSNTIRGAVGNWSKTLANEVARYGVTVNNILPGATETERLAAIIQNKSNKTGLSIESVKEEMLSEIPAARFGKPEEAAYAACFLASPFASYITGTNVVVDGGRTGNL
jgi:3-oxoacyl-[acyl-carrier protein] reductase